MGFVIVPTLVNEEVDLVSSKSESVVDVLEEDSCCTSESSTPGSSED